MNLVRGLVLFGAFIGCAITFFGLGEGRFASLWLARLGGIGIFGLALVFTLPAATRDA